ncbi:UNVERIFIED_CONTAM: hypothetical protein FKN15_023797 [Acipenser sinensis]
MEKDKMPYSTNTTPTPQTLPYTTMSKTGHSADPWHSTPKQKKPLADIESMTIQKQRKELQLLIVELKDRDKELNNMVLAYQKQIVAWEVDRQRVLTLEQRCARLESKLHNRNDIIRALTKKIKILEAQQKDRESALTSTQEQLQEIFHRELEASSHCQDLAEKNQSLNSSVVELSSHVGQMQAREQELAALLKLKDKDMMEATDHIIDLTTRFKKLETAQRDGKLGEVKAKKETQEIKQRLREVKHEMRKLKDDLREKTGENNSQREDLIRLKQENQHLHNELALAGERERRKDELLELAKSKKERTETELYCLRQVCENQQNDLQLLHLNLESSQERLQEQEERIHSSGEGRLDFSSLGLDSPMVSAFPSPDRRGQGQRGSSVIGNDCLRSEDPPVTVTANGERRLKSAVDNEEPCSPTSRLQRLLTESKQMVANLERATLQPVSTAQSHNSSESSRGHLHDKYGQLVAIYSSLLINKMNFHAKDSGSTIQNGIAGFVAQQGLFKGSDVFRFRSASIAADSTVITNFQKERNVVFSSQSSYFPIPLFVRSALSSQETWRCRMRSWRRLLEQTSITCKATRNHEHVHSTLKSLPTGCIDVFVYSSFQLTVDLFDYLSCELKLAETGLPVETLQGHRERFHDQFHSLKNFFNRARDMLYFKRLIQIPKLPDSPPNFLRASALAEHVKPVVVMSDEVPDDEEPEALIEVTSAPQTQQQNVVDMFDQAFGPPSNGFDDRDVQIDNLKREVEMLRAELERIKSEAQRYITQLKSQINSLEAELEEQRTQKQKALVVNEQLRMELESLRRQQAEGESQLGQVLEAEKRAQATEQRYNKLKDKHNDLVSSHAELLRKSADTSKMLSATQQSQEEVARTKQQLAFEVEQVKQASEMKIEEQNVQLERLRRELEASRAELSHIQSTLQSSEQSGQKLSSMLGGLQEEEGVLRKKLAQQEVELCSLKSEVQQSQSSLQQEKERSSRELGELQGRLREKSSQEDLLQQKLLDEQFRLLQGTVAEAENIIQDAVARLDDPLHVRCTSSPDYLICRAEATLGSIDSVQRGHAEYLNNMGGNRAHSPHLILEHFCRQRCNTTINQYMEGGFNGNAVRTFLYELWFLDAGSLVRPLTQFAHLTADTIVNGSATAHLAPTDHADKLTDSCRDCGNVSLQFLKDMKNKQSLARASPAAIKLIIEKILQLGKVRGAVQPRVMGELHEGLASHGLDEFTDLTPMVITVVQEVKYEFNIGVHRGIQSPDNQTVPFAEDLRPKSMDFNQEELGDMVDKEMAATSAAIEEAVRRIEEMMNQARKDSSGVKLEVNERILNSCTNLMKGAATQKEFYAKNSRWTEGLISASKAVGWGATQMVESADKVVLHTGKYEELIVCSHEIAASTAQLVAASKVKADLHSKKLTKLQQASRHVNDMAANVVASTKSGQEQIEDKDTMDFSGMSLIKLRKEEMESQVCVSPTANVMQSHEVSTSGLTSALCTLRPVCFAGTELWLVCVFQVKVLELETQLQGERMRLGDLRKKHYELAGVCDFSPEEAVLVKEAPASLMANKPSILKKPPLAQKPTMPSKNNNQVMQIDSPCLLIEQTGA